MTIHVYLGVPQPDSYSKIQYSQPKNTGESNRYGLSVCIVIKGYGFFVWSKEVCKKEPETDPGRDSARHGIAAKVG
jgi:hypothetical protein